MKPCALKWSSTEGKSIGLQHNCFSRAGSHGDETLYSGINEMASRNVVAPRIGLRVYASTSKQPCRMVLTTLSCIGAAISSRTQSKQRIVAGRSNCPPYHSNCPAAYRTNTPFPPATVDLERVFSTIALSLTRSSCSISHRALDSTAIRNGNDAVVSYPRVSGDRRGCLSSCSLAERQDEAATRPIMGSTNVSACRGIWSSLLSHMATERARLSRIRKLPRTQYRIRVPG